MDRGSTERLIPRNGLELMRSVLRRPLVYPVPSPFMDSISSHLAEYQGRLAARKRLANLFDRRSAQISNLRVVAFAVILIILWLLGWFVVPAAGNLVHLLLVVILVVIIIRLLQR